MCLDIFAAMCAAMCSAMCAAMCADMQTCVQTCVRTCVRTCVQACARDVQHTLRQAIRRGIGKYRHAHADAVDVPSAMPMPVPSDEPAMPSAMPMHVPSERLAMVPVVRGREDDSAKPISLSAITNNPFFSDWLSKDIFARRFGIIRINCDESYT